MGAEQEVAAELSVANLDRAATLAAAIITVLARASEGRRRYEHEELIAAAAVEIVRCVDALRHEAAKDPRLDPEWWSAGCLR